MPYFSASRTSRSIAGLEPIAFVQPMFKMTTVGHFLISIVSQVEELTSPGFQPPKYDVPYIQHPLTNEFPHQTK